MNPLTNVRNIAKLNEQELKYGIFDHAKSWHNQYKDSAYIFLGGLPYELTEGDVLCVFSQYGEIVNINLVRDKKTGKFKGYGFLAYEDQKSTILAVDNLNGIKLGGRTIRVDHVEEYRRPKGDEKDEKGKFKEKEEAGCAPRTPPESEEDDLVVGRDDEEKRLKKDRKKKKKKKEKKAERRRKEKDSDMSEASESPAKDNFPGRDHKKDSKMEEDGAVGDKKDKRQDGGRSKDDSSWGSCGREKENSRRHGSREAKKQEGRDDRTQKEENKYSGHRSRDERRVHERFGDRHRRRSRSPPFRR